jgi:hypothetical protein
VANEDTWTENTSASGDGDVPARRSESDAVMAMLDWLLEEGRTLELTEKSLMKIAEYR